MVAFGKTSNVGKEVITLLLTGCSDNLITEGIVITFVDHQHPDAINELLARNLGIEVTNSNLVQGWNHC